MSDTPDFPSHDLVARHAARTFRSFADALDENGADQPEAPAFVKVTEVAHGEAYESTEGWALIGGLVLLEDMLPPQALEKSAHPNHMRRPGRFRITTEFWPEDAPS